ncbi:hypothetical protein [Kitasatospora sp. DSM 101779]|uniref:hypothetical protein n=1 Tax=Kitasatospora sp. DSM 101779 TaxID=2853165 RepID=UPI0021DAE543|nr:hypothetical protein [Kitasatospora sp. DSM 101779]MCU7820459.1 hypothetical protein [Kitasatospora sp. DSM 101779]
MFAVDFGDVVDDEVAALGGVEAAGGDLGGPPAGQQQAAGTAVGERQAEAESVRDLPDQRRGQVAFGGEQLGERCQ